MSQIEAVFQHGVFRPLGPVYLADNQRVRLNIEMAHEESAQSWLQQVRRLQAELVGRVGVLPDSARDIAEDRLR
jgi:predicted DNA-binding antitoxin AbrB/MazE fold protein